MRKLSTFALIGAVGFLVDVAFLYVLISWLGVIGARLVSFLCAVFTTWLLNRRFTFEQRSAGPSLPAEFVAYLGLMLVGGAINYGVYATLIYLSVGVAHYPILGVAVGSIAGMACNFASSNRLQKRFESERLVMKKNL